MISRARIIIASAIFITITAVKFLVPGAAALLRDELIPTLAKDLNYKAVITELGSFVSSGQGALLEALGRSPTEPTPNETVPPSPEVTAKPTPSPSPSPTPSPTPTPSPSPSATPEPTPEPSPPPPTPEPTPEVVSAFLESQSSYSEYAVPANVSYDMPLLPFEYTAPVYDQTSDGFGFRTHPIQGGVKFHYGTDFAAQTGVEILAFSDGVVKTAGEASGYGKYVVITHDGGFSSLYAHCSELLVSANDTVTKGSVIAKVGSTGDVTGPHLHFELLMDGVYLNPEFYIKNQ